VRNLVDTRPTRLNLLRSRRRLVRVREGAELLRRKREALVRELLSHARPAVDDRERIGLAAGVAYPALAEALAREGSVGVTAAAEPLRDVPLTMRSTQVWGLAVGSVVEAPTLERSLEARGTAPGPTSSATIEAAEAFETLVQLLVEAAPREMLLRRLGQAVAQTSRQVRALERRVEPALGVAVARITTLLDEREREEHLRLRHFLRSSRKGHSQNHDGVPGRHGT
jgi:V/A-type H+-transporting ATPase subunit D